MHVFGDAGEAAAFLVEATPGLMADHAIVTVGVLEAADVDAAVGLVAHARYRQWSGGTTAAESRAKCRTRTTSRWGAAFAEFPTAGVSALAVAAVWGRETRSTMYPGHSSGTRMDVG